MAINKEKVMDAARKHRDKGQVDKAIKEYLKIVQDDPKDVRVWLKIGDLYVKKGAKDEATETYLKVAKFYGEQGFYLKAVAVYKQILKLDPRLVEVNLKLAELYRQLGLLQDAVQHFEHVAAHFHREGKSREALATIRQLVDLDPENVATRIKLAELYSKEGMVDEAVKEFAQACEFLRKQGRTDDFIKVAERLLWHKADDLPLNRELATIYLKRNDPRRALQKLQTCFKANPRDLETLAQLAQAFQALDQKAKTVSVLKEMARVLVENGQREQAADVHRKILVYAPTDPDSRAFLGDRAAAPERTPPPMPASHRAAVAEAVLSPGNLKPKVSKGPNVTGAMPLVREPLDDDAPAAGGHRRVDDDFINELALDDDVGFEPESSVRGEAHAEEIVKILTEADVYVKYGLHQKAIDHLRKVFDLDPRNVEARERLKDIFLAQGRVAEAINELLTMAEQTAGREPERAIGFLREVLAHAPGEPRAHELAARYRLDLATAHEADLGEFEVEPDAVADGSPALARVPSSPRFESEVRFESEPADHDGFEFELDDDAPADATARRGGTGTMEVDPDQLEEAEAALDAGEELDFDGGARGAAIAAPVAAPDVLDEFEFDPDDARAFDAAPVHARAHGGPLDTPPPTTPPPFDRDAAREFDSAPAAAHPGFPAADDDGIAELDDLDLEPALEEDSVVHGLAAAPAAAAHGEPGLIGDATGQTELPALDRSTTGAEAPVATLEDDLDEADFFVTQGLFAEARDILGNLLARYPNNPLVAAKLRDVEVAEAGGVDPLADDALVDELEELDAHVQPTIDEPMSAPAPTRPSIMLEKPVDDTDADTHFDLGLAYREMGLFDEAIKAFTKVRALPGREVQSHLMIGMCHRDQGNLSEAINQFKAGLYVERITPPEKFGLYYEIGTTYELLDDPQEALYYHEMVLKKDPSYRDVSARVAAIRGGGGGRGGLGGGPLDLETDALDNLEGDGVG